MRKGSIYIIRNIINDKVYIGQTIQNVDIRFKQHLRPSICKQRGSYKIYNAMNKYGKDKFYYDIIEDNIELEDLNEREIYYIELFDSYYNGYNSTKGGDGRAVNKIDDIDKAIELFNKGLSYKEIGEYFGVCGYTIKRLLNPLGFKRSNDPKISKEDLIKYQHLFNYEIAEILGVNSKTVSRSFKRYGISRGKGCNNYKLKQNQEKCND